MTKSKSHIEKMHSQLSNVATREQLLIEALGEALSRADKKLLDDVRSVTIEHESRRAVILTELQTLASRIGAFPDSEASVSIIDEQHLDLPYYAPDNEPTVQSVPDTGPVDAEESQGADWRQAAKNIRDQLDLKLNGNGTNSSANGSANGVVS